MAVELWWQLVCTFVTVSEMRGIVYGEHMAAVAAVVGNTGHDNLDESGSLMGRASVSLDPAALAVFVLGTCKAPHVNSQTLREKVQR